MKAFLPALFAALASVAFAIPAPPDIPSKSNATALLEGLVVAAPGSGDGYSRAQFPHWITISGTSWISGASSWTKAQRQAFANDLGRPQLWAVTDNVNASKGDKSPDRWKPPLTSFYSTYAESWVRVKSFYALTVTSAEKQALADMLGTC